MDNKNHIVKVVGFDKSIEEEITIEIKDSIIECFCHEGSKGIPIGSIWNVELNAMFFNEVKVEEATGKEKGLIKNDGFSYTLYGIYDADTQCIDIGFKVDLTDGGLYDYGYLDGKFVEVTIAQFDIVLLNQIK